VSSFAELHLDLMETSIEIRGVTKRCRLSWLTNSPLVYEPKYREGSCGTSANEYSSAHGAQINLGDLTSYLTSYLTYDTFNCFFASKGSGILPSSPPLSSPPLFLTRQKGIFPISGDTIERRFSYTAPESTPPSPIYCFANIVNARLYSVDGCVYWVGGKE
jgi:hypothetical protein